MSAGATVLERELLGANSNRIRHHHRHEDANLILQLGTVVTAALQDIDSPPSSECTPPSRSQIKARTHHGTKRVEERNNDRHDQVNKCRSNNHILPYQFVLQDHNYGAPPPPTPPLSPTPPSCSSNSLRAPQPPPLTAHDLSGMAALATVADQMRAGSTSLSALLLQAEEDSRGSPLSSDEHDDPGLEGEETETAAEGEGDEDSVTRCICDLEHDDGYMICCDKCCVWQHVDCMGIDRLNIPEEYLCELCQPRRVDRIRARNLQMRKQMHNDTSSSDDEARRHMPVSIQQQRRLSAAAARKRPAKREPKKVVKRQRRDSAAVAAREQRVSERRANKKKESMLSAAANTPVKSETKRIGTRRRSKGKGENIDEETQDGWGNSNGGEVEQRKHPQPLRQWIDNYEEAVTNHYSPELRARISSIKVNGVHSDFKVASSAVQRCRTSLQENGVKIIIATSALHANQPIIEVRGKYMLANQQSLRRGGGGGALSPSSSPYLLFYTLPKEGTEVCVDARTYGNDARFVRRSCKPNAEVRHCIEKGTLHLYLVASGVVDRHSEICIKHEDGGARFPCKDCPPQTPTPTPTRNGYVTQEAAERGTDRRRRGSRRSTISEESSNNTTPTVVEPTPSPPVPVPVPVVVATPPVITTPVPSPPVTVAPPSPPAPVVNTPVTRRGPKSPVKTTPTVSTPSTPAAVLVQQGEDSNEATSPQEDKESAADKRKMTREERKMEAIMKAFERMEKAEQRKQQQQQQGKRGDRDDSTSSRHSSRDDDDDHETVVARRKGRRTRGRSSSGASNQATSADESCGAPMLSPATPVCASPRALASPPPPPVPSPEKNNSAMLLTNCLGFKFPKTKKVLMNEWLNKPAEAPVSPVKLENNDESIVVGRTGSAAAKKRWLRQAISEECELPLPATPTCSSPNSRGGSPPCGDYVTPLKKRRMARASVSSEQSFTPPTTPASDKEGAHSPDLEEAPAVDGTEARPPASQIHNAARCVEEAVMAISANTNFLDKIVEEKIPETKKVDEVVKIETETPKSVTPVTTIPTATTTVPSTIVIKQEIKSDEEKPVVECIKPEAKPILPPPVVSQSVVETKKIEPVEVKKEEILPPPLPVILQAPCTPPPAPSVTPPSAPSTPTSSQDKESTTPASIKRKLSISEYRQRKQREEVEKGDGSDETTSPNSQDEERPSSASPSDTLLEMSDTKTEGAVPVGGSYMRWSSEPTLVERQRENLTERLKREFGLFVDDQDPNRANKKAQGITGIVGIPSTTTISTTSPLNNSTAVMSNDTCMLPVLPPLQPPTIRSDSPHNIPLPPCSPPPLHDLLAEPPPPPPPLIEDKLCNNTTTNVTGTFNSKSIIPVTVQNGPLMNKTHGKSLLLGGVQIKNQTSASIVTTSSSGIVTNVKKPIPTSSTTSVSKSFNTTS